MLPLSLSSLHDCSLLLANIALGTLYAYQKAAALGKKYGVDLDSGLKNGSLSVALYHTAGKGTRLAPLPGAENNNKPGVKLAATVQISGESVPMTILEGVVKQTGCYGKSRRGRLSVFWGDQIFIPSTSVEYTPGYHADILCSLGPMMSAEEWAAKGMDKYGLIVLTESGKGAQVEKVTHATAMELLSHLDEIKSVGASLGSFSVSSPLLFALLTEFDSELSAKKGKLDSDPHLWMPMTLERDAYVGVMGKKNVSAEEAGAHYDRVRAMLSKFLEIEDNKGLGVFGPVDVGSVVSWWDYGQLKLYQASSKLMFKKDGIDGQLMRTFFGFDSFDSTDGSNVSSDSKVNGTSIDSMSYVTGANIGSGSIKKSVVNGVNCVSLEADDCVLINVTCKSLKASPGSIVYNVCVEGDLNVSNDAVMTGVTTLGEDGKASQIIMVSNMSIDGGKVWDEKVEGNRYDFAGIHSLNKDANPLALEVANKEMHASTFAAISNS